LDDDQGGRAALENLAHFLSDPLERIQALALDLGRQDFDSNALDIWRKRFSSTFLAKVDLDLFFPATRSGIESRLELRALTVVEHHPKHIERELRLVGRQVLRLRPHDAELELAATLHHLEIEAAVFVALALSRSELLFEITEAIPDFGDVAHEFFNDRCAIFCQLETIAVIIFLRRE
jgi:hypothetical protein